MNSPSSAGPGAPSTADRVLAVIVAAAVHLAVLGPLADEGSVIVPPVFQPEAEAILDGALPYADRDFEYPPLALPVLLAPGLIADGQASYSEAFAWEMIVFDLAIVALLGFGLRAPPGRVWAAVGVYTAGVLVLSGFGAPESVLDASLPLARFDLVPAALVLAALIAREAGRSATWSALLAVGAAVKAFPLLLYPVLVRGEPRPLRVALAALVPLAAVAVAVVAIGDEFGSAVGYHTGRDLQIETVAATPLLVAHLFGAPASWGVGGGSYNLDAPGAETARAITVALLVVGYVLVVWAAWRSQAPPLVAATAVLAVVVILAPVLSPQFLLWLLPVSAAVYGLRIQNVVLLAAVFLTQVVLDHYDELAGLSDGFIAPLAVRNALLLCYLALVVAPLVSARHARLQPA
ncbi:MAG: glycosyltransferase 87 family protein [Solirubrobacterales bacterium]